MLAVGTVVYASVDRPLPLYNFADQCCVRSSFMFSNQLQKFSNAVTHGNALLLRFFEHGLSVAGVPVWSSLGSPSPRVFTLSVSRPWDCPFRQAHLISRILAMPHKSNLSGAVGRRSSKRFINGCLRRSSGIPFSAQTADPCSQESVYAVIIYSPHPATDA